MSAISIEQHGAVRTIRIGDDRSMGRLNAEIRAELLQAIEAAAADGEVRAIVLRGSHRAFSVGQDLAEFPKVPSESFIRTTIREGYAPIVNAIVHAPKPVVAALTGATAGAGLSIALACDLRVASSSARLTTAFAGIGLSADTGITWTLPRIVGRSVALDLLLRPRAISAQDALRLGIVSEVCDDEEFDEQLDAFATGLAAGPTLAFAAIKAAVDESESLSLDDAMTAEAAYMVHTAASRDHREAVSAFLEKRAPSFLGE